TVGRNHTRRVEVRPFGQGDDHRLEANSSPTSQQPPGKVAASPIAKGSDPRIGERSKLLRQHGFADGFLTLEGPGQHLLLDWLVAATLFELELETGPLFVKDQLVTLMLLAFAKVVQDDV